MFSAPIINPIVIISTLYAFPERPEIACMRVFFGVGKYLVVGAFMTSLIQTLIPRGVFVDLWTQNGLSLLVMMGTAFLFSACSTSDAFIARSFMDRFSIGAIMGFLVFGPMMDIKNMLMLLENFKKSFVVRLSILVFIVNFIMLYFFAFILL